MSVDTKDDIVDVVDRLMRVIDSLQSEVSRLSRRVDREIIAAAEDPKLTPGGVQSLARAAMAADSELVAVDVDGDLRAMLAEGERLADELAAAAREVRAAERERQQLATRRDRAEADFHDQSRWAPGYEHPEAEARFKALNKQVGEAAERVDAAWATWERAAEAVQRRAAAVVLGPAGDHVVRPEPGEDGEWS